MEILITEDQLKLILEENNESSILKDLKKLSEFTEKVVSTSSKVFNFNIRMFLTWGASIGGFMLPLDNFIKTNYLTISESERVLILIGLVMSVLFNSKRDFVEVLNKIKELNLEKEFNEILNKAEDLLNSFTSFIKSLGVTIDQTIELVSYCFLIPIITDVENIISNGYSDEDIFRIVKRIFFSGLILINYGIIKKIFTRLVKIFR